MSTPVNIDTRRLIDRDPAELCADCDRPYESHYVEKVGVFCDEDHQTTFTPPSAREGQDIDGAMQRHELETEL
jgi:hypothetical protein